MTFTLYDADMAPSTAEENTSDTNLAFLPTSAVPTGVLAVVLVVWDNVSTTNGDDTEFLSVADSKGNAWTRAAEAQYSAGGSLDGVLAGFYYSVIATQIETTDTITITSTAAGTAKAATLAAWSRDGSKTIAVAGKNYQRAAAANSYTVTVGSLTSEEHLWIGMNAVEADIGGLNGQDDDFSTTITQGGSINIGSVGVYARAGCKITTSTTETYNRSSLDTYDRCTVLVAFKEVAATGGEILDPFGMSGFFGA